MTDRTKLRRAYARLKGLERAMPRNATVLNAQFGQDFNSILNELTNALGEDMSEFQVTIERGDEYSETFCYSEVFNAKLFQAIAILEQAHHVSTDIVEIGSLYNLKVIDDAEAK